MIHENFDGVENYGFVSTSTAFNNGNFQSIHFNEFYMI